MHRFVILGLAAAIATPAAQAKPMKWMDATAAGLPAGAKFAVVSGDPSKAGPFVAALGPPLVVGQVVAGTQDAAGSPQHHGRHGPAGRRPVDAVGDTGDHRLGQRVLLLRTVERDESHAVPLLVQHYSGSIGHGAESRAAARRRAQPSRPASSQARNAGSSEPATLS